MSKVGKPFHYFDNKESKVGMKFALHSSSALVEELHFSAYLLAKFSQRPSNIKTSSIQLNTQKFKLNVNSLPGNCLCWGRKAWSFKDLLRGLWLKNILSPRWPSADWDSVWPETDWSDSTWEPRVRWRADGDRSVERRTVIALDIYISSSLTHLTHVQTLRVESMRYHIHIT